MSQSWGDVTEPPVDRNSDEIVTKRSKLDLSPPATPPKRPPPEVRSCDSSHDQLYDHDFPGHLQIK